MNNESLGLTYEMIGKCLQNYAPDQNAQIFLYAEAQPGVMGEGAYQNRGGDIVYIDCGADLGDLLFTAWEEEEPNSRWSTLEFVVKGGRFTASFGYDKFNEIDPVREHEALRRHFGDKPIFYPGPSFEERYEALNPASFPSDS